MSKVTSSSDTPSSPIELKDGVDQLGNLVDATKNIADGVLGNWENIRTDLGDVLDVINQFKPLLKEDETLVHLPPGAAASIKDLSERQSRISSSAADVLGNLDDEFPDFRDITKALEAKAEQLKERAVEVERRYKELLSMPIETFQSRGDSGNA